MTTSDQELDNDESEIRFEDGLKTGNDSCVNVATIQ